MNRQIKRKIKLTLVATALGMTIAGAAYATNYSVSSTADIFACNVRPVAASNSNPRYLFASGNVGMVQRSAPATVLFIPVAPGVYVLMDNAYQACIYEDSTGNSAVTKSGNCTAGNMDGKPVWSLNYVSGSGQDAKFALLDQYSGKALDTGGYTDDGQQIYQYTVNGGKNQLFYLQNCFDAWRNSYSPAVAN